MPKVRFYTLGCKVNQYETQAVREGFLNKGFKESKTDKADIYVVNTCTVTNTADRKSRERIYRCIRNNPKAKVVVTGCYVEKDSDKIAQISGVDLIIPNEHKDRIADIVSSNNDNFRLTGRQRFLNLEISDFSGHGRAFVKIQDGCDNHCSYCKIPYVRGESRSREFASIVKEVSRLVNNGFQEIVLTGICLGAYGRDLKQNIDLVDVITAIEDLGASFRIRLSSIEAKDVTERLIQKIASSEKLCKHLHIPFQSADNEILKLMNRNYTAELYKKKVDSIRESLPDVAITTDIMVGFPQESESRFQNTFKFLEEVSPSRMHIFPFSPRENTAAYKLGDSVNSKVKKERLMLLQDLAKSSSYEYRKSFLNKELVVLVEQDKDRKTGLFNGYSDNYIKVLIQSKKSLEKNKLLTVKVTEVTPDFTVAKTF